MSQTRRQLLMDRLSRGPATVRGLALELKQQISSVVEDLDHVRRSLRSESDPRRRLVVQPATCLGCGRVFRKRERLTAPSRCPDCKSESTTDPEFWIAWNRQALHWTVTVPLRALLSLPSPSVAVTVKV